MYSESDLLISVIIPIYNTAPFLPRCIDSLLCQNYKNLEIILVNDGSTDESGRLCDDYVEKDKRVQVIHKPNGGQNSARKAGLRIARGKYVSFIDSDDWIEKNAYEELELIAKEFLPDIIECFFVKEHGELISLRSNIVPEGFYKKSDIDNWIGKVLGLEPPFIKIINGSLCNKLIRKDFLEPFLYRMDESIRMHEDSAVSLWMFGEAESLFVCHKAYYHYCTRDTSMTYAGEAEEWGMYKRMCCFLLEKMDASQKNRYKHLIYRLFDMLLDYITVVPNEWIEEKDSFPFFENISRGDRVVIYGKGLYAKNIIEVSDRNGFFNVVENVDSADINEKREWLKNGEYDHVLIAIGDHEISNSIRETLLSIGVEERRIKQVSRRFINTNNFPEEIKKHLTENKLEAAEI